MVGITSDMVRQAFSAVTFDRGSAYYRNGAARVTRISADGLAVTGEVLGSQGKPYRVRATVLGHVGGIMRLDSQCSCPMGGDCKHVVALLLQSVCGGAAPATVAAPALSDGVAHWLAQMDQASRCATEDYPPDIRRRLIYVLSLSTAMDGGVLARIVPMSVPVLKDGSFSSSAQPYGLHNAFSAKPAQFLRPSDFVILRRMAGMFNAGPLSGETGAEILDLIVKTGRCHWESLAGPLLRRGEPRPGAIRWSGLADGRQRPLVEVEGGGVAVPLSPPWYVDGAAGLCGPVETGLAPRLAGLLLEAPPIEIAELPAVRSRLAASLPNAEAHLPPQLDPPRRLAVAPVPRLLLHRRRLQRAAYFHGQADMDMPLARLSFLYDGHEIVSGMTRERPVFVEGHTATEIVRSRGAEREVALRLQALGFVKVSGQFQWRTPTDCRDDLILGEGFDEAAWIGVLTEDVPHLAEAGWRIDIAEDFPVRLATPDGQIEAELRAGSGVDWFDLHLGVPVNGERIDILPLLLRQLRQLPADQMAEFLADEDDDDSLLHLRLEDGRLLTLPFARVRPILLALASLFTVDGDSIRVQRTDAADLAAFAEALPSLPWRGGDQLRELGRRLRDHSGIPAVPLPDLFVGSLRPYQQAGLEWMQLLRDVSLGGVLADDMGLGKTVQTLAHMAVEKAAGRLDRPCLVVAPTSLMANWRTEAKTFTPSLSTLVLQGADRKESFAAIGDHDIVFTTYPLLGRDAEVLTGQDWHMVILDEAQYVKNPATTAAKVLRGLTARHRLALSGTPLENHLGELWSLFDFVSPGFLGERTAFTRLWRTPIEKRGDEERRAALARRVKPFLLRRTKAEVAADLPPKTEIVEHVELAQSQRDLYEGIRLAMHKKVREAIAAKGLKRSRIELLDALLKLRQSCCDSRLVKTARAKAKVESAKLNRLMEMLPELIGDGRRILLFSQFTSMLALIEAELQAAQFPYVLLTGDTRDRATPVRRFQNGEVPLFLISLKAGGTGLNLTAADTVIHYDPWWNPAVEAQATDRAHRIGQDKPVFVYKLVAGDTIEVKMAELKLRKQALAEGLFDPEAGSALDIGEDDVEFLLGE